PTPGRAAAVLVTSGWRFRTVMASLRSSSRPRRTGGRLLCERLRFLPAHPEAGRLYGRLQCTSLSLHPAGIKINSMFVTRTVRVRNNSGNLGRLNPWLHDRQTEG